MAHISCYRHLDGTRKGFEDALNLMVFVLSLSADAQVHKCGVAKAFEEVEEEFCGYISDTFALKFGIPLQPRATAEIEGYLAEAIIHRQAIAIATDAEFVAEADDNTVFYFDGEYLKSNATGYYLVSNSNFLGYDGDQTEGSVIAFRAASNNLIGAYNISFNDGARWLYCNQNNFTDAGGSTNDAHGYCFNIEEVEVVVEPETPTAIENVETEAENAEIYDLTGRKVENITKAGIYIVNGCKVLVK